MPIKKKKKKKVSRVKTFVEAAERANPDLLSAIIALSLTLNDLEKQTGREEYVMVTRKELANVRSRIGNLVHLL